MESYKSFSTLDFYSITDKIDMRYTIICLLLLCLSCKTEKKSDYIFGKWEVSNIDINIEEMSSELIEGAKKEALSTVFIFNEDGSIDMSSLFLPDGKTGVYEINDSASSLKIIFDPENPEAFEKYELKLLEDNNMEWYLSMAPMGDMRLSLTKAKE